MNRPFRPNELSGLDGAEPTGAELAEVASVARRVEGLAAAQGVHPSAAFVDGVMGAIAAEPLPQPALAAGIAARRGRFGAMVAALAGSWRVVTSGDRPFAVRAQALAFVLLVVVAAGSLGGVAAVGAWQLLAPPPTPAIAPTPPVDESPSILPSPTTSPEPSPTIAPSEIVEPTASPDPSASAEPSETTEPSATDDRGGSDSSGSAGSSKTAAPPRRPTPEPSMTEHPEDTPEPSETPQPTEHH